MSIEHLLNSVGTKIAIDAIYYVTRLIRHRSGFGGTEPRLLVEGLANEPSPDAEAVAYELVKEIEKETGTRVENLNTEGASALINRLERLARHLYIGKQRIDRVRGDALLKELRGSSTY